MGHDNIIRHYPIQRCPDCLPTGASEVRSIDDVHIIYISGVDRAVSDHAGANQDFEILFGWMANQPLSFATECCYLNFLLGEAFNIPPNGL
jgi:hypothetical protein